MDLVTNGLMLVGVCCAGQSKVVIVSKPGGVREDGLAPSPPVAGIQSILRRPGPPGTPSLRLAPPLTFPSGGASMDVSTPRCVS